VLTSCTVVNNALHTVWFRLPFRRVVRTSLRMRRQHGTRHAYFQYLKMSIERMCTLHGAGGLAFLPPPPHPTQSTRRPPWSTPTVFGSCTCSSFFDGLSFLYTLELNSHRYKFSWRVHTINIIIKCTYICFRSRHWNILSGIRLQKKITWVFNSCRMLILPNISILKEIKLFWRGGVLVKLSYFKSFRWNPKLRSTDYKSHCIFLLCLLNWPSFVHYMFTPIFSYF
jgi:hypothetical protein